MNLIGDVFGPTPLGSWGLRNHLNAFFCKYGYGKSTGYQWNNKVHTYTPLARFIYNEGVDGWMKSMDLDAAGRPEFNIHTVLTYSLQGSIFSKNKHNEILKRKHSEHSLADYYDESFYKKLCKISTESERGELLDLSNVSYFFNRLGGRKF